MRDFCINMNNILKNSYYILICLFFISCSSVTIIDKIKHTDYPPDEFILEMKVNILSKEYDRLINIHWQQSKDKLTINLSALFNIWHLKIVKENNVYIIDDDEKTANIDKWFIDRYDFHLPISLIPKLIFLVKNKITTYENWYIDYSTTQSWHKHQVSKKIILTKTDGTTITILIKVLN